MKILWYILSMLPLYFIVAILSWKIPLCWPWGNYVVMKPGEILSAVGWLNILILAICVILITLSVVAGFVLHHKLCGSKSSVVNVSESENISWDMMSFVASFFFPVVSFNLMENTNHAIVLMLLYLMIGRIFVLSDKYYSNPTLLFLGYYTMNVKSTEVDQGKTRTHNVVLISRDKIKAGDSYTYIKIDEKTYYAKRYNHGKA